MQNFFFPSDGSQEWLTRIDARLAVHLLKRNPESNAQKTVMVLEVGVWKGAWTSVLLSNYPRSRVVGVDPYPGLETIRTGMLERLDGLGMKERFELFSSFSEVPDDLRFDLIHIDGEHSEEATLRDLNCAKHRLKTDGVIIVDDFRHMWFPGVASALFRFCNKNDFRLFLTSANKAYIARIDHASKLHDTLLTELENDEELLLHRHYQDRDSKPPPFIQRSDVLEQPVLICTPKPSEKPIFAKKFAKELLPPLLLRWLRRLYRR